MLRFESESVKGDRRGAVAPIGEALEGLPECRPREQHSDFMDRPRYLRAPSPALHAHLGPQGLLAPLLRPRTLGRLRLDVHLREGNRVHAYYAQARIINAHLTTGRVHLDADPAYHVAQGATPLFSAWDPSDRTFESALDEYLNRVPAHIETHPEGHVQAAWSGVVDPWVAVDREAVIGYADGRAEEDARRSDAVSAARDEVAAVGAKYRPKAWAKLPAYDRCAELDQLAIDPEGRLVLIELKYGRASPDKVYYAPLQLLQYAHEWRRAFAQVRADVETVRESRGALGLSPAHTPRLTGGLRLVLGFGEDLPSKEVLSRVDQVRAIANRHLPEGAAPIEKWAMKSGKPVRLS